MCLSSASCPCTSGIKAADIVGQALNFECGDRTILSPHDVNGRLYSAVRKPIQCFGNGVSSTVEFFVDDQCAQ